MKRYTAIAERSGDWWAVRIDGLPGVFTQAKRLDQIPELAADAIGLWLEKDPATIHVDLVSKLGDRVLQREADLARRLRSEAAQVSARAATQTTSAVARLSKSGLSYRDIGSLLGISYQRVEQLVKAGRS
jgi:predicted RNase H-like HicB family nuclease/DNA-binding CsgD family transcriptional regulator